jgi:gliding motility-associated-like protein
LEQLLAQQMAASVQASHFPIPQQVAFGQLPSVSTAGVVTGIAAGTTTITYTVTTNGCTNSATSTLTISSISGAPITGATSLCVGATTTLANTNPNGAWTTSNPAVASVSPSGLVTGLTAGTAIITYTVTANGCSSASTSPVTVNALPTVGVISGTTNGCVGSTITLSNTTSGGVWTTSNSAVASVSAAGVVTGLAAGTATITYTVTTNGCTNSATSTLTISSISGAPITGATSLCVGATTTLANTNPNGVWTTSNSAVASVSPSGLVTGIAAGTATITYTVTANGCSSASTSLVTVNALPTVGAITGTTNGCVGSSITLSNTTPGGVWTTSNSTVASISATGVVTGIAAGTTTITYTVTANGCTNTATSTLTISSTSGAPITGATSLCVGATTTLANTNPNGVWTTSNSAVASVSPSGLVTGIAAGTATITYTVTANGCSSSSSIPMTVFSNPTLQLDLSETSICLGDSIMVSINNPSGLFVNWLSPASMNSSLATQMYYPQGTTNFVAEITNSSNCVSTVMASVTVHPLPILTITPEQTICIGQEASITVDGAETYIWSPQGSNSTSVFSPVSNTVYSVIGMTNFGCSATVSTTIFVTEGPIAAFSSNNISVSSDNTNVLFTNLSSGATSSYIQFSNAGGSILFNSSIQHLFPSISGNYEVILLVEDSYGCTDSAMIVIQVYEDGNCFIPNTFTPDGEQFNNVFMPVFTPGFEPQNFEFTIFNRWGELIFESNNPAYGWDGYDKNGLCQDGTYTWTIRFEKSFVDKNIFLTGHVNLLR